MSDVELLVQAPGGLALAGIRPNHRVFRHSVSLPPFTLSQSFLVQCPSSPPTVGPSPLFRPSDVSPRVCGRRGWGLHVAATRLVASALCGAPPAALPPVMLPPGGLPPAAHSLALGAPPGVTIMALRLRIPPPATFVHQLASLVGLAASPSPSPPSTAGSSLTSPTAPSHLASPSFFAALLAASRSPPASFASTPASPPAPPPPSGAAPVLSLRLQRQSTPPRVIAMSSPPKASYSAPRLPSPVTVQLLYTSHSHRRAWWGPSRRLHRCRPCRDLRLLRRRSCRRPLCRRSTRRPRRRLQRCRPLRRRLRCRLSRRRSTRRLLRCRSCQRLLRHRVTRRPCQRLQRCWLFRRRLHCCRLSHWWRRVRGGS
mmetsp:Transcript_22796/g.73070  ORF Transcript_22796/g.73070 Transcript_22796/m.73070 type:complete len:370 (+) Transcript_22796:262-1371(+)